MAPVGKVLKAMFLGLMSRTKSRKSAKNAKGRQIFGAKDLDAAAEKLLGDDERGSGGKLTTVYWGQLPDGCQIAVKVLDASQMKGTKAFCKEASLMGNVSHKNVLGPCGFCCEKGEFMLVYKYMVNISLDAHFHGPTSSTSVIDWAQRVRIAVGAAEGLAYLHQRTKGQFVHGKIKSTNVLLDANFEAKWADFGLMNLMQDGCFSTGGTKEALGYLSPEYLKGMGPSQSGDVFGFGMLLLELISGKKPSEKIQSNNLREWTELSVAEGRHADLLDPKLNGQYSQGNLDLLLRVASKCTQLDTSNRPSMMEVVELLKDM